MEWDGRVGLECYQYGVNSGKAGGGGRSVYDTLRKEAGHNDTVIQTPWQYVNHSTHNFMPSRVICPYVRSLALFVYRVERVCNKQCLPEVPSILDNQSRASVYAIRSQPACFAQSFVPKLHTTVVYPKHISYPISTPSQCPVVCYRFACILRSSISSIPYLRLNPTLACFLTIYSLTTSHSYFVSEHPMLTTVSHPAHASPLAHSHPQHYSSAPAPPARSS